MTNLLDRFSAKLLALGVKPGDGLLLGYSGGADSTALLGLLLETRELLSLRVAACHVHHGIRGESADRDERFCRERCEELGIEYFPVFADVPERAAAEGRGLEETGRAVRYESFERICREQGFRFILTAHHADDNLETLLLHLTRGCGPEGLCGIPERRGERILRPLLTFCKDELLAYCHEKGLPFTEDESNGDESYSRNLIRAKVLPVLRQINPAAATAATRTSALLRQDRSLLLELTDKARSLPDNELRGQPDAILSRVLEGRCREVCGEGEPTNPLPYEALLRLCALYRRGEGRLSLPRGITAVCEGGALRFEPDPRIKKGVYRPHVVLEEGKTSLPDFGCRVTLTRAVAPTVFPAYDPAVRVVYLRPDAPVGRVTVRGFCPGDTLAARNRDCRVCELLRGAHIPPKARKSYPLLCDGERLLAVPGIAVADGCSPAPGEEALKFTFFDFEN